MHGSIVYEWSTDYKVDFELFKKDLKEFEEFEQELEEELNFLLANPDTEWNTQEYLDNYFPIMLDPKVPEADRDQVDAKFMSLTYNRKV